MRMSLQPMLERVVSGVESKKAVFSTSTIGENEAVSLIGMFVYCCLLLLLLLLLFFLNFFLIRSHSLSGADVIDTLPSLHPLVCLHSNVRQKAMDEFLQNMMEIPTSDTSDVTNSVMTDLKTSPKNTIRSLSQSHISV